MAVNNSTHKQNSSNFNNDMIIEEGDFNFGSNEGGFRSIALEQLRRCCIEGSKEFCKGGVRRIIRDGKISEIDQQNQRDIFINSVFILYMLLIPIVISKCDKKFQKELSEIDAEIKAVEKKTLDDYNNYETLFKNDPKIFSEKVDTLNEELELRKLEFNKKKLIVLSFVLSDRNYFEEAVE